MQAHSLSISAFTMLVLFTLTGCQKDTELGVDVTPATVSAGGNSLTSTDIHYASTVFYYREQPEAYVEMPLKKQAGTFGAYPKGLVIDPVTGAIDINKSESGLTYRVWFKPTGSSETVNSEVTIAGINFQSRIYNLASGDDVARPLYNVQNNRPAPLGSVSTNTGGEFANDNDRAIAGLLKANKQQQKPTGLQIDGQSGAINLRKAVDNGVFGANPVDGTVKNFRLYYRLNDGSNKALNYIDVRLHYYSQASAVPASLLALANYKTKATFRQASQLPTGDAITSAGNSDMSSVQGQRPPDIIIISD